MSLIEQLGGYENARERLKRDNVLSDDDFNYGQRQLLKYRRQHNIYEVLDWIMYEDKLYEIKYIYHPEKARITDGIQGRTIYDFPNGIRHATDAEIAAGHRL